MVSDRFDKMRQYALCLVQALLGVISPNFRCVTISHREEGLLVRIYLESQCDEDAEEIDDLFTEFEILLPRSINLEIETIVTQKLLNLPLMSESFLIVFKRRERVPS